MKRTTGSILAGMALALATSLPAANGTPRTISVSGTVDAQAAPDQIVWSIHLSDFNPDLQQAKAENDARIAAVLALRKKLDIAEGDIETGYLNIRRIYERGDYGQQGAFKHFSVSRLVTIRQRDLKRFDEYLDTLVASSDMEVDFRFESSRIHEVRAEARLEALKVARQKAEAMAAALGEELGQVQSIDEHSPNGGSNPWGGYASNSAMPSIQLGPDVVSERFIPGAIGVHMTVYATFSIVSP